MNRVLIDSVPVGIGSAEHRQLLAQFFVDTHVQYVPESIDWPMLELSESGRLRGLPFWQEAVSTENMTASTVVAAAALEADPALRRAIELQGFEEQRHARLLQALTTHYGIAIVRPEPYEPRSLESDFLFAGFGECFDSFFAFGLFALAQRSGYFPAPLVAIFEPVIQEEARHILFFVNWVKYRCALLPWWRRPLFKARCAGLILRQVASRVRTAWVMSRAADAERSPNLAGPGGDNFTLSAHQELGEAVTLHDLLALCLSENERRLGRYDERLARPQLVPAIARFLYRCLPARL